MKKCGATAIQLDTPYRSQDTHNNFTVCDHIKLLVRKARVAARDSSTITLGTSTAVLLSLEATAPVHFMV